MKIKTDTLLYPVAWLLIILGTYNISLCQIPHWQWARQGIHQKATGGDVAMAVQADRAGNVYETGSLFFQAQFGNTVLSDLGAGVAYLVKYDSLGSLQWATCGRGDNDDVCSGVTFDTNGNPVIAGFFLSHNLIFGNDTLHNLGTVGEDVFVVKYDPAGNIIWAKNSGTTTGDRANGIAADRNGNTVVVGYYGHATATFGSFSLPSSGNFDVFVAKYDNNGNVLWAKGFGGPGFDVANKVAVDDNGNVFVTGYFCSPTLVVGHDTLVNPTGSAFSTFNAAIFITKLDSAGNILWARSAGGTKASTADKGVDIAADHSGNVFVTGHFGDSTVTFGNVVLHNKNGSFFLAKYDASGNVSWAKCPNNNNTSIAYALAIDNGGNPYVTGSLADSLVLDTILFRTHTSHSRAVFIAKFNTNGIAQYGTALGDSVYSTGLCVHNASLLLTGYFQNNGFIIGPDTLVCASGQGLANVFVAQMAVGPTCNNILPVITKVGDSLVVNSSQTIQWYYNGNPVTAGTTHTILADKPGSYTVEVTDNNNCSSTSLPFVISGINEIANEAIKIYPNPLTEGNLYIDFPENWPGAEVQILDADGRLISKSELRSSESEIACKLALGMYFVKVTSNAGEVVRKLIRM